MNWFPVTYILTNSITNSIDALMTTDYRSSGMYMVDQYVHHSWD